MASFASGTSQQYIDDYYRRVGPSLGGTGPETLSSPYGQKARASRPPGDRTNRYDGSGFGADGTRIPGDPRMSQPRRGHPSHNAGIDFNNPQRPGQAAPRQDSYGTSTPYGQPQPAAAPKGPYSAYAPPAAAASGPAPPVTPYMSQGNPLPGPNSRFPIGYRGLAAERGGIRTAEFRDTDFDGTDDRDQAGPGVPGYGSPGQGQGGAARYLSGTSQQFMRDNPDSGGPGMLPPGLQASPPQRPPPFQTATQNFDGTTSQMPNFQQRDAFIANLTGQLGNLQRQSQQTPGMGAPQFNFPQLYGQAGQMVEQGFQNPFALRPGAMARQQPGPPPPQGSTY